MKYAVVIVDSRPISNESIDNHVKYLNMNKWHLHVYSSGKQSISTSHFSKHYYGGGGSDYNRFITSPQFWRSFVKYDYVLIIQQDSKLFRKGINEFIEANYDYYGAPWKQDAPWARKDRSGGNGGLSLRKPLPSLELCLRKPYNESKDGNEDVYFTHNLQNVAPHDWCKKFSLETEYQLGTLGCHAVEKHLSENELKEVLSQYD